MLCPFANSSPLGKVLSSFLCQFPHPHSGNNGTWQDHLPGYTGPYLPTRTPADLCRPWEAGAAPPFTQPHRARRPCIPVRSVVSLPRGRGRTLGPAAPRLSSGASSAPPSRPLFHIHLRPLPPSKMCIECWSQSPASSLSSRLHCVVCLSFLSLPAHLPPTEEHAMVVGTSFISGRGVCRPGSVLSGLGPPASHLAFGLRNFRPAKMALLPRASSILECKQSHGCCLCLAVLSSAMPKRCTLRTS